MSYEVHQVEGAARFGAADRTRVSRRSQWWILGLFFALLLAVGGAIMALPHSSGAAEAAAMRSVALELREQVGLIPEQPPPAEHGVLEWQESWLAGGPGGASSRYQFEGLVIGRTSAELMVDIEEALDGSWQGGTTTDDDVLTLQRSRPDGTRLRVTLWPLDDDERVALPGRVDEPPATESATHLKMRVDHGDS